MVQKVVNDKGGLHNRITKHIHLEPFTLTETKAFLQDVPPAASESIRIYQIELKQQFS